MASIFTYDPDPPRVASPWLRGVSVQTDGFGQVSTSPSGPSASHNGPESPSYRGFLDHPQVTKLQAEPQDGPVEYKLHLLLRARRRFKSTSTGTHISGSKHSKTTGSQANRSISEIAVEPSTTSGAAGAALHASTQQTRQHRLEQLTTQLLWRLQQSSPHHTSSATNIILPSLPEALPELEAPQHPAKLLHGLEESQGALYEIGVSDDGTLVGLAEDEMRESLNNLRAMAACLGCTVEVLRRETVGECEWLEDAVVNGRERKVRRSGKLVVVEALVKPHLQASSPGADAVGRAVVDRGPPPHHHRPGVAPPPTEQLRITLTGPTMSGKSTLLGTLTTSTLDNGRGKSRVSMLKHRHEITSGVTSSVTQELLGYQDVADGCVEVLNYATENVASWIDIHVAASGSRLVFISDSAGHPRYRRTTIRGLVGWIPHYTLLCVPADDTEDTGAKSGGTQASQQALGSAVSDLDLSGVQLDLCLRLNIPLVVVVTKLDVASRIGLKRTLTKILDALKAAGRRPAIVPNTSAEIAEGCLQNIDASAIESAYHTSLPLLNDARETVPIVLISAVQGNGISNLHALLHELPIPVQSSESAHGLGMLFHIEDIYNKPAEVHGIIVSGRLRSGRICVGDTGVLGPFSVHHDLEDSEDSDERPSRRRSSTSSSPSARMPASRSFPGALRVAHLAPPYFHLPKHEWRRFRVVSIRNLRLPVHALEADQVGTVALVPDENSGARDNAHDHYHHHDGSDVPFARVRKGMVLSHIQPSATRTFAAEFRREDLESLAVGNHVVVYVASVRASAKVVSARVPDSLPGRGGGEEGSSPRETDGHDPFGFDDVGESHHKLVVAGAVTAPSLLVTFHFDASKEFVVVGDQVLVMPGGGPGLYGGHERGEKGVAGLEGFVGKIMEVFE